MEEKDWVQWRVVGGEERGLGGSSWVVGLVAPLPVPLPRPGLSYQRPARDGKFTKVV